MARPQSRVVSRVSALRSSPPAAPNAVDFDAIYRTELGYVWNTLRRLGVRDRDLEDLAHDVFVVVHRRLADYDPNRPLRPWLFGIAFRIASDDRRRARHSNEVATGFVDPPSETPGADDAVAARQDRELVLQALSSLDLDRRAVFVMHEIDGTPVPEISTVLGAPVNTVYSRLRLAREQFAAAVRRLRTERGSL
jgi:RNA polymerase sigma-70 factor (ECF subfamily)